MNAPAKVAAVAAVAVEPTGPLVYAAIAAVMSDLASEGIAKDKRNTQGSGYNFRGIDDVYNALSRSLADNRLVIIPRVLSRETVERSSKSGGALFYTVVEAEFDLISADDGSKHTARTVGEAMDSGDKSSNKAMSAAYKYMAFQTFCIPTEGDNDADATTHQLAGAEAMAINLLRGAGAKEWFKEAWDKNKDGWKAVLPPESYARVVAVMKECAAKFTAEPAAPTEPKPAPAGLPSEDEIPF